MRGWNKVKTIDISTAILYLSFIQPWEELSNQ